MNVENEHTSYYHQAKELALKTGWVSVSLIQRRLRLSYGMALSILQGLEHRGVIESSGEAGKWRVKGFAGVPEADATSEHGSGDGEMTGEEDSRPRKRAEKPYQVTAPTEAFAGAAQQPRKADPHI